MAWEKQNKKFEALIRSFIETLVTVFFNFHYLEPYLQKQPPYYAWKQPQCVIWNTALKNFAFAGKHLLWKSVTFLIKLQAWYAILSKERIWHWCFPVNFVKFIRPRSFTERLRSLLLYLGLYETSMMGTTRNASILRYFGFAKFKF